MEDGFGVDVGPQPREDPIEFHHALEGDIGPVDLLEELNHVSFTDILCATQPGAHCIDCLVFAFYIQGGFIPEEEGKLAWGEVDYGMAEVTPGGQLAEAVADRSEQG